MPALNISDKFVAACSTVIDTNYDTCGTITQSSIAHLKKEDLNALFTPGGKFADLDAWFQHSLEMKACGTRTYAWYDWIMANADRSMFKSALNPGVKAVKGPDRLFPFIMGRQESVVNRDFWKVNNSILSSAYTINTPATAIGTLTAGPLTSVVIPTTFPGGAGLVGVVLRITNLHGIPLDANWFKDRDVLHVFTLTGGVSQRGNWRVLDAAVNSTLTYIDVLVVSENAASDMPFFNFGTGAASGKTGLIIPGINNVNDYEMWCQNQPNIDPRKMVPFWFQTRRSARCVDDEYLEVYARLMTKGVNEAFRQFGDLDLAERNRQDELEDQHRFVNAFFFQKPISINQTLSLWESLEDINTVAGSVLPGISGKLKAKRANWVGVKEQLRVCDRVFDLQGNPLNLIEFFDHNYAIYRARKSQGKAVKYIDWYTNTPYREAFHKAMTEYYKDFYGQVLQFNVEVGKETELGMIYDTYRIPKLGSVTINVISDEFFDDWRDENAFLNQETAGNMMLALEIGKPGPNGGTIYYAMLEANRKQFGTAKIEELAKYDATYRCVMETTGLQQTLMSESGMPIVECPRNSTWIENIGPGTPIITGKTLNPSYQNLY